MSRSSAGLRIDCRRDFGVLRCAQEFVQLVMRSGLRNVRNMPGDWRLLAKRK